MASPINADRVWETTTTTGTGTLTLLGPKAQYQGFAAIGDGNDCYYEIRPQTGTDWETVRGTVGASGTTLTRTNPPLSSSNGGAPVNFGAGTKDVFQVFPAEVAPIGVAGQIGIFDTPANKLIGDPNLVWDSGTQTLIITNPTALDDSEALIRAICTNTAALTANVEFGGESNNLGETDYVVYCHTQERLRIFGSTPQAYYTVDLLGVQSPGSLVNTPDTSASIFVLGTDGTGNPFYGTLGTLTSGQMFSGFQAIGVSPTANVANGPLFLSTDNAGVSVGLGNSGLYETPLAQLHVQARLAFSGDALFSLSYAGVSGKFQTLRTDGANANPTVDVLGNTAQTANLQNWRGTDGSTIVASVGIGGTLYQAPTVVASLPAAATAGAGARAFVTDALLPAFGATVANGGAVSVPVYSDGTNWKVG